MSNYAAGEQTGSYEYVNEYMYFVLRPDEKMGKGVWRYCSGANLFRFLPLTKKRHGLDSNPAMRGLQLVNINVRALALANGTRVTPLRGNDCSGIAPTNEGWYSELILLENAPDTFPAEIVRHGVVNLLKKIMKACCLDAAVLPDRLLEPDELQVFIDELCKQYVR